jgi:hypothetical protein
MAGRSAERHSAVIGIEPGQGVVRIGAPEREHPGARIRLL